MQQKSQPIDLFVQQKADREKLYRQTPIQDEEHDLPVNIPKIPNSYTPMGEIQLDGLMNNHVATGKIPWWVLLVEWFFLGISIVFLIGLLTSSLLADSWWLLLVNGILIILQMMILWRGTKRKRSIND